MYLFQRESGFCVEKCREEAGVGGVKMVQLGNGLQGGLDPGGNRGMKTGNYLACKE